MEVTATITKLEIWHKSFNINQRDNLEEIPAEKAVYGIFAIVNGLPANCRYIGKTDNLRSAIRELFENPPGEGMKEFMQGAWIQLLQYKLTAGCSSEDIEDTVRQWTAEYKPDIDEDGEYPGYYNY